MLINRICQITLLLALTTGFVFAQSQKINLADEYYFEGELDKAADLYAELSKQKRSIPLIHANYFKLLIDDHQYDEAEKYMKLVLKAYPGNLNYKIDYGLLQQKRGREGSADNIFNDVIEEASANQQTIRIAAQNFVNKDLAEYAVKLFKEARKEFKNPYLYALDLANIYRRTGEHQMMVLEYLNFVEQNPANLSYVKRILQSLLTEEDLASLENLLYDYVQKFPDKVFYSDLLIWVNLQQKNFYGAFIQARAYDKRFKTDGKSVMDIGFIAFDNGDYRNSTRIFDYIIKTYPDISNRYYIVARRYNIMAQEEQIKNIYPVDTTAIKKLIGDYDLLVEETGINSTTLEGMRSQAMLFAFYLGDFHQAISLLNAVIENPRTSHNLRSRSKLDLGDIYLLSGEPWESALLYMQVEKTNNDDQLGYEAKLRNAKLSFYKGDFQLAEEHLDVLKQATTREIANDAMELSLLIKDNTVLDTTHEAMMDYANVELLLFQNQKKEAMALLAEMLEKYPGHTLTDEIWWLNAQIEMKSGNFQEAITWLQKINEEYSYDILSDDAYFLIGFIYETQLQETEKAKEIYRDFLERYPGSKFTAEARKRFRYLRGDFVN